MIFLFYCQKWDYEEFGALIADILATDIKDFVKPTELICFSAVHNEYSIGGNTNILAGS